MKPFDVRRIRIDFPILHRKVYGKPLVYLDNAATALKPQRVIEAMLRYYSAETSNVHRGIYFLSETATNAYEGARILVQRFLNASNPGEIIFVRSTTEAINLVAASYGRTFLRERDEIILSVIEHHSNIVPWQILCNQIGAVLRIIPVNENGEMMMEEYEKLLSGKTKLVSVAHVSNAIGSINPVRKIIASAHQMGAAVLIDGAQAAAHLPVDVQDLDCDFYAFSGHKVYGPTGIGVLYGKSGFLEKMPPYQGGGEMIRTVTFEKTTYNSLPLKFEAGTPAIAEAIGLGAAIEYVSEIGLESIEAHEQKLLAYATEKIMAVPGARIIGTAREKSAILSFVIEGVHPHDVATIVDKEGVAIRAGHHCAMPAMQRFDVPATARASFALYNITEEVDSFIDSLYKIRTIFN